MGQPMPYKSTPYIDDQRYSYSAESPGSVDPIINIGGLVQLGTNAVDSGGPLGGYRKLISVGDNATTPLSGTAYKKTTTPSTASYEVRQRVGGDPDYYWRYRLFGNMMSYFLGSVSSDLSGAATFIEDADNQARAKFFQRVSDTHSEFKGMVFTGELKETLSMVRNPARALRSGISDYLDRLKKDGPRRARRDRPKFVRETWLEYAFGWRPLVNDLEDAITAFYKSRFPRPIFKMVRASARNGTQQREPSNWVSAGNAVRLQWSVESSSYSSVKYYGVCRSIGNGPGSFGYYGFSPWEFVPTLWELIPYSFLVDYFTNIGDIINAWSYRSIACAWAARGEKRANRREIRDAIIILNDPENYKFQYNSGDPGASAVEFSFCDRNPSPPLSLPNFSVQVPGMGTKWVNMLALTSQLGSTRRSLAS